MTATTEHGTKAKLDWGRVYYHVLTSRRLDDIEETRLVPEKKVLYQFSARGHDVAQAILYLSSDVARFVTGVVLEIAGGWGIAG